MRREGNAGTPNTKERHGMMVTQCGALHLSLDLFSLSFSFAFQFSCFALRLTSEVGCFAFRFAGLYTSYIGGGILCVNCVIC